MTRSAAIAAVLCAAALLPAAPAAGAASPGAVSPGGAALVEAEALADAWGRCPTARPAARTLATARRLQRDAARPAVKRRSARAALGAWRRVAEDCAMPVAMPTVVVAPAA